MSKEDPYINKNTGILINTRPNHIKDQYTSDFMEEKFTESRYENFFREREGYFEVSFNELKYTHRNLYQDMYPWAGRSRDEDFTTDLHVYYQAPESTITREGRVSDPASAIEAKAPEYFSNTKNLLDSHQTSETLSVDKFSEISTKHIKDVDQLHPFRTGNDLTLQLYLKNLATEYGFHLKVKSFEKEKWLEGSKENPDKLKDLISENLTVGDKVQMRKEAFHRFGISRAMAYDCNYKKLKIEADGQATFVEKVSFKGENYALIQGKDPHRYKAFVGLIPVGTIGDVSKIPVFLLI